MTWLCLSLQYKNKLFKDIPQHFGDCFKNSKDRNTNKRHTKELESLMEKETGALWCLWCHANIFRVRHTHPLEYLCVFVEVLGRPVLDVRFRGGLSQGEFWENATAGARHHVPGISTGLKLGAGSEVLRLTGDGVERGGQTKSGRGNRERHSSLRCCCTTSRAVSDLKFLQHSEGADWD